MIKISLAVYYPLIQETLDRGATVTLTPTGMSMYPFLVGGRDRLTLSPLPEKLKKNDLPLYRRANGAFVLHRIVKVCEDGTYTCCGDHQWWLEKGLRHEQMIGLATEYVRKGRSFTNENLNYRIYRTVWTWLLPIRRYLFWVNGKWHGLKRRLRKLFKR